MYILFRKIYKKIRQIFLSLFIIKDYFIFCKNSKKRFLINFSDFYPCIFDKTKNTSFNRHYIYHPAWAARIIVEIKPEFHVDISSSLAFCSMLSAFVPVRFYDYRPADLRLSNLQCEQGDLLKLPFKDNSITSLSCMHTIEHIGLGRYGDAIDYDGDLKALSELKRVTSVGGSLLIVVPIGDSKIFFNAHRIYSFESVIKIFNDFYLKEFALIPEDEADGGIIYNPPKELINKQKNNGCGCFWFIKK